MNTHFANFLLGQVHALTSGCIKTWLCILALCFTWSGQAQSESIGETPTWAEAIASFEQLQQAHPDRTRLETFGYADVGRPLHLFVMGPQDAQLKILVNNAIHPGEPCGVNACIQWADQLLNAPELPGGVSIAIVPMYNIGGGLRRNCCTRANQNGPEQYGFRGNARNLDLNRDFIKCDSRNALAFNAMFTSFDPDLFVDTHTTNGADYQATMTLISTQHNKLGGPLGAWLEDTLLPELYKGMGTHGSEMCPYVYSVGSTPDEGIQDFLETPRFSTGYAALHHTIGFTTEAHMLKPFDERVEATLHFLNVLLESGTRHAKQLNLLRNAQDTAYRGKPQHPVNWALDTTTVDSVLFKGYEARYEWSNITESKRLKYDRNSPWERNIAHFHTFKPTQTAPLPAAFIVPQAWRHVIERLQANGVTWTTVPADTTLEVTVTRIGEHSASSRPYEGHHLRTATTITNGTERVQLFAGDLVIPSDQRGARYLHETLSPQGVDSFFRWNFFDSVLQQKEHFSSYVFEETAERLLQRSSRLQSELDSAKNAGPMTSRAQLDFIYQRSPHHEGTAGRYPVYHIPAGSEIPFDE